MYSIDESILIFLNSFEGLYSNKQLELLSFFESGKNLIEHFAHTKQDVCNIISENLYTSNIPDPDLLIRTGGEQRISNYLLWQVAYSEIYVTDIFWPDFTKEELFKAVANYQQRERRYGKTTEQLNRQ